MSSPKITITWGKYEPLSNDDPEWDDKEIDDGSSTQRPSLRPSGAPTVSPSSTPSDSPTDGPTATPTVEPSVEPSVAPTTNSTPGSTNSTTDSTNEAMNDGYGSSENTPQNPSNAEAGAGAGAASDTSVSSQRTYVSQTRTQGEDAEEGRYGAINAPRSGDGGGDVGSSIGPFKTHIMIGAGLLGGLTVLLALLLTSRRKRRRNTNGNNSSSSAREPGAVGPDRGAMDSSRHPSYVIDKFDDDSIINNSLSDDSSMDSSVGGDGAKSVASQVTEIVWSFSNIERQGSLQPTEEKADDICM